jgi:imidazolonepropionase-like amidohydrolase
LLAGLAGAQQPTQPPGEPQQPPPQPPAATSPQEEPQDRAPAVKPVAPREIVIRNATVMTAAGPPLANGSVHIRGGKIVAVGANLNTPAAAMVIDARGKFVTPGIIDSHGHIALNGDVNEATSPVTPHMMMEDAFEYTDKGIYRALAGGVTTSLLLHGSANMIGGQALVIKHKYGRDRDELLFEGAPRSIKFATGENPKRVYGGRQQVPSTRMGNFFVVREAMAQARDYMREWDDYHAKVKKGDKDAKPPKKDLKLEALADIMRGKLLVQIHCYRADEFLTHMAIAREFGYKIRAFHHALEAYKVADQIAAEGIGIATFSDWWGFKHEAWDAIPWNAAISMRKGVKVAIKSDSGDYVRRLNQEAGKIIRYGGATPLEALQMVTLNAAWVIGVQDRVGSLEPGKDADVVIWNKDPLSTYALADMVLIDGEVYFDRSLPGFGMPQVKGGR